MASTPDLLGLPTEMQLHVISFVNTTDLISLRLTWKELKDNAMDDFAAEYLHDVGCLFLEPARLTRLANLLSSDDLARRIGCIHLTINIWEYSARSPLLAPEKGESHLDAWRKVTASLCAELYPFATEDTVDWDMLEANANKVAGLQNCCIHLSLMQLDRQNQIPASPYSSILSRVLTIVSTSRCSVHTLRFSDDFLDVESELGIADHLLKLTNNMADLSFRARLLHKSNLEARRPAQCIDTLTGLGQAATRVESLYIGDETSEEDTTSASMALGVTIPKKFFLPNSWPALRELTLSCLTLPSPDLVQILAYLSSGLQVLHLDEIALCYNNNNNEWPLVLRQLQRCTGPPDLCISGTATAPEMHRSGGPVD